MAIKLLYFYTEDCKPCKTTSPKFSELEKKYKDVVFEKVNATQDTGKVVKYNIQSVPTILFLENEEVQFSSTGNGCVETVTRILEDITS